MSLNFIIVSLSPWDYPYGSNIRDIAIELSKEHQVLFVNIPLKRTEVWSKKKAWVDERKKVIHQKTNQYVEINENLKVLNCPIIFEPINRLRPRLLFDFLNKLNNNRYAKVLVDAVEDLGWNDFYLINDNDFYSGLHLPELLKPIKSIYYLRDYMRAMSYWSAHSDRLEPMLIKAYDIICANSTYLAKYASKFNPKSFYVGQGCDVDYFVNKPDPLVMPADLLSLPGKKIGYVGALNGERLAIDMIQEIANHYRGDSIVLVGPQDEIFAKSSLHDSENVHFLGAKDFSQLNNYIYNFDVCINPQASNQITVGNYPRKVDEYLATGKPVVATNTESMLPFSKVVYLASSSNDFIQLIAKAITENSEGKEKERITFAKSHTWENSVSEMLKTLSDV